MQHMPYVGDVPKGAQAYAQYDIDAGLVDSGKIQYTMVGTTRPRPG